MTLPANLPTYGRNETSITALKSLFDFGTTPDFDGGCNLVASCAPGIGISTGTHDPSVGNWTTLDQAEVARTPQDSQHIGGNGQVKGDDTTAPVQLIQGDQNPDGTGGTDNNDTLAFAVATNTAATGAVFDSVSGAVNRGAVLIVAGERAWGAIPV